MKRIAYSFLAVALSLQGVALGVDGSSSKPANAGRPWPGTTAATRRVKQTGVPNFGKLNDVVWRSGQPTREGYRTLAGLGLKTVVNLREEYPQDKEMVPSGITYVYMPVHDEDAPTDQQAKQFLDLASNPENWPLLVHCNGGEGRVGVMSAIVRHSLDGWDHDTIMKEAGYFRVKYLGFVTVRMAGCQRAFIQRWEAYSPARVRQ